MASTAPPILPITVPQSVPAAASSSESQPPIATPALRSFINNISSQVREGLSQRRPWTELVDRSAFSRPENRDSKRDIIGDRRFAPPENVSDALGRLRRNYTYFRVNYVALIAVVLAFSLLTNPGSLFLLLGVLCAWSFCYLFRASDQPLVLFGRSFSERETLGVLVVGSVFVIFLTSVGSVLISALLVGVAIVAAHGAFRVPEDLFLDDQEQASTGFLSFVGATAKNAAAAAPSVVAAARV